MDQPRGVTPQESRWLHYWDLFYAVVLIAVLILLAIEDASPARRVGAGALLIAWFGWWWAYGRGLARAGEDTGPRPAIWVAIAVALFAGAIVLVVDSAWASPALIAQIFWLIRLKYAAPVVVLISFLPGVLFISETGDVAEALITLLPAGVIFGALSVMIGYFVDQLTKQSEQRAELIARLEASRAEVAALSHDAGIAAERERLAREIHDTLAQGFTSIVTLLQAAESEMDPEGAARRHVHLAVRTARDNLDEARAMVTALTPSALEESIGPAARRQIARFAEGSSITVSSDISGELPTLATATEVVLLRATQEALTNVRKHANATMVSVSLHAVESSVRLVVRDDGVGFRQQDARGYGLTGMRARVDEVGGAMTVHSEPDNGTTLTVEVPT